MFIVVSITFGGAIVFITGHFNPNLLGETIDYVDTKFTRAIDFGNYLVNATDDCMLIFLIRTHPLQVSIKYGVSFDTTGLSDVIVQIESGLDVS